MNWAKLIAYVLGGAALIVLGWVLHSTFIPKPTSTVETTVIHDTTYAKPKPPITIHDTTYATRDKTTITTSTSGTEQGASYKIEVAISEVDKVLEKYPADWKVDLLLPPPKIIKETVVRDSIRTLTETKFISKPFFLNEWFYVSLFGSVIAILIIIFR